LAAIASLPKTKIASEAPGVVSLAPPVPAVCR